MKNFIIILIKENLLEVSISKACDPSAFNLFNIMAMRSVWLILKANNDWSCSLLAIFAAANLSR